MNKPLILAREDFVSSIKALINNSGLPIIILEPIIKDIYTEINSVYMKQYKEEKEKYELECKESSSCLSTERD